jgi:hypothetical protein
LQLSIFLADSDLVVIGLTGIGPIRKISVLDWFLPYWPNASLQYKNFHWANTDIFRIGPIPVSPITARSESTRRFDNCKEKSREILDWLINKTLFITLLIDESISTSETTTVQNN